MIKPVARIEINCSSAGSFARLWLTVDDVRVPGTVARVESDVPENAVTLSGVTTDSVPAGNHTAAIAADCLVGDFVGAAINNERGVSAVVLGG